MQPVPFSTAGIIVTILIAIVLLFMLLGTTNMWTKILTGPISFKNGWLWIKSLFTKK